jgi:hypothetical protein
MSNNFKHRCSPRSVPPSASREIAKPAALRDPSLGAGSGGDPGDGGHAHYANCIYQIDAEGVEVLARSGQPRVTILATTLSDTGSNADGLAFVNVHADKAIRMTSGTTPDTLNMASDGIDIITELDQEIMLERGLNSPNIQRIQMTSSMILVDGNLGGVTIQSMESIKLQVAGGASSIELTPEGITLQGLLININ